jgi:hypothetical protein
MFTDLSFIKLKVQSIMSVPLLPPHPKYRIISSKSPHFRLYLLEIRPGL